MILLALWLLLPRDGSGYAWEQRCTVTPTSMTCVWYSGPERIAAERGL